MPTFTWLLALSSLWPLYRAWQANRANPLLQTLNWAFVAWMVWVWALWPIVWTESTDLVSYLALSLTGCATIAVLGARRPGVGAWNFVVLGLLAVLLLPVAECLVAGNSLHLSGPRLLFLAATLAVGLLNYLPTRLAPAAILWAVGCAGEIVRLANQQNPTSSLGHPSPVSRLVLVLAPWIAYGRLRWQPTPPSEFDRVWLEFRDRFGLFWSQRLRDQFNGSAAHADWPVFLRWQGLRLIGASLPGAAEQTAILAVLYALLRRFGPESEETMSVGRPDSEPTGQQE